MHSVTNTHRNFSKTEIQEPTEWRALAAKEAAYFPKVCAADERDGDDERDGGRDGHGEWDGEWDDERDSEPDGERDGIERNGFQDGNKIAL